MHRNPLAIRKKGFNIRVEKDIYRITIRLQGRWTPEIGQDYLAECRQTLSGLSSNHETPWTLFLDLIDFHLPPPEVLEWLERGFLSLRNLNIKRQAILLHGPILHLPGLTSPQAGTLVSSYFQSEDEALEWLMEKSVLKQSDE